MKSIPKIVLITTLALGASLSIAGLKSVRADSRSASDSLPYSVSKASDSIEIRSSESSQTQPVEDTFEPEVNDPPKRTGGTATR